MRPARAALAAVLPLLALVLQGCGREEEAPVDHVPCLGGCFTEATTSTVSPTTSPYDNHDLPAPGGGDGSDAGGDPEGGNPEGGNPEGGNPGSSPGDGSGNSGGNPGSSPGNGSGNSGSNPGGNNGGSTLPTPPPVTLEPALPAVRNCYLDPLYPAPGCKLLQQLTGDDFGLNSYGQETTAKRTCLEKLREANGNAFIFAEGQCELWNCSSLANMRAAAGPQDTEESSVSFGTWRDTLISVGEDGMLSGAPVQMPTDGAMPAVTARFQLVEQPSGKVALRSMSAKKFVTEIAGGALSATADAVGVNEMYDLIRDDATGTVAFKAASGNFFSVRDYGPVLAQSPVVDGWERLRLIENQVGGDAAAQEPPAGRAEKMEVFSSLCQYQEMTGGQYGTAPRAPVYVKLWEWNYDDIARECQEWLAPNGVDAVQVSPVAEHITGPNWWAKYKPVSYGLNSRSGSKAQFAHMVKTCRAAGVEVLVDIILNHMADPCDEGRNSPFWPCTGWNGTRYGNRRSQGAQGWDEVDPSFFHHLPGREMDNCGVGADTGYLCGGNGNLRDCSCCSCDLYGLPDYNTSLDKVKKMQTRHLFDLHDIGVTMARIDASLYEDARDLAATLHRIPWDTVYQEWWGEFPVAERTAEVGLYRDVSYRWKIADGLWIADAEKMPELLQLDHGVHGLTNEISVYPIAYHDGRSNEATADQLTYKMGLMYHQAQRFLLAWPKSSTPILWGGYGWSSTEQGPPGCSGGEDKCLATSVFKSDGETNCMPTPTGSPLPEPSLTAHQWICEHRWDGVAGLINFRKQCRGLDVTHAWAEGAAGDTITSRGHLAYRLGQDCFVALVRGNPTAPLGAWNLASLNLGLPAGRYCDMASLPTTNGWDQTSCPREVTIDANGMVTEGTVRDGDMLAIHTGARLTERRRLRSLGVRSTVSV